MMLKLQDYRCAICGKKFTKKNPACIDHDHSTNKVRSLLCKKCNVAIGLLKENLYIMYKAMRYIERYKYEM